MPQRLGVNLPRSNRKTNTQIKLQNLAIFILTLAQRTHARQKADGLPTLAPPWPGSRTLASSYPPSRPSPARVRAQRPKGPSQQQQQRDEPRSATAKRFPWWFICAFFFPCCCPGCLYLVILVASRACLCFRFFFVEGG